MELIAVNYGELYKRAGEMADHCRDINRCMREFQEDIENLDIFWDGDANNAFILKITEDIAFINSLILRIYGNVRLLTEALGTYESYESDIRKILDGINLNNTIDLRGRI